MSPALGIGWRSAEATRRGRPSGVWFTRVMVSWLERHSPQLGEHLAELRGCSTPDGVVMTGAADQLPWAPGCTYLSPLVSGQLWLPVGIQPDRPETWVLGALRRAAKTTGPVLWLPDAQIVVRLDALGPIGMTELCRWASAGVRA